MKVSSKYKRFKRINFSSNTLTSLDVRSLIIRNLQRCNHYPNTDNLQRLEKEAQIKEIDTPKTDKTLSVSDRAIWSLLYLIIEISSILVFYSYATKYHKLSSMFVPGYRCSNVYINVEKGASMNKDIQ